LAHLTCFLLVITVLVEKYKKYNAHYTYDDYRKI
jgi:hypothetical protein